MRRKGVKGREKDGNEEGVERGESKGAVERG